MPRFSVGVLAAVLRDTVGLSVLCRARSVPRNNGIAEDKAGRE
jgi:hypothetical protein